MFDEILIMRIKITTEKIIDVKFIEKFENYLPSCCLER
jgi:hypothetical protein